MGRWGVNSVNNLHLQRIHSWPRAIALHCLLTQAGQSLMAQKKQMAVPLWDDRLCFTHDPRAIALHCLLTQAGHSLMAQKKQMTVPLLDDQSLVLHS